MDGSRDEAIQTAIILAFPMISAALAGIVAHSFPVFGFAGMILLVVFAMGFSLIIATKLRAQRRSKKIFDLGPVNMTNFEKICYILGYILVVFSCLSVIVMELTGISLHS